ncbi:MAG: hypothetical protein P8164_12530 [Gammaproteobacteria bacterium]
MSDKTYQIVVAGELVDGTNLPEVKAKLAALFKTPAERLDPLFSGKRVVIKKGLAADIAGKYVAAVRSAGLQCRAEEIVAEGEAQQPSPGPTAAAPGISLAPVGVTIIEPPAVTVPKFDVSAYSMAPAGETLIEPPAIPALDIDISALNMDPVGDGTQLVEAERVAPAVIDTANLNLAPAGSDVGEMKREEGPPPPDTSHLNLD